MDPQVPLSPLATRCPRCHPVAVAENTITEPTETPTTVPGHHADEDKPASGTGEMWDLPAPPEHERGRDAATDAARPSRGCRRHPGQTGGDPTAKGQLKTGPPQPGGRGTA